MPLDVANSGAALVAGAPLRADQQRLVRVQRAFLYGGEVQAAGSDVLLPRGFAAEMVAAGKAQPLPDDQATPAEPVPADPAPATPAAARGEPAARTARKA